MNLHNFNSSNRSWKMYANTLSSISGDQLTLKPYDGQNLLLEVSANNNIFIKKGDASYNLSNLITATTTSYVSGSDASFSNIDVSRNLNPLTNNGGSLGSSNKYWGNAFIRDLSARNISISGTISVSGDISNVRQIIPQLTNDISTSLGTSSNIWQKAFIRDLSAIVTINGSTWPQGTGPTGISGPTGPTGPTGPAGFAGPTGPSGILIPPLTSDISNKRIITTQRIYQNICGDISWNAVNGYYGLAKDAYPALDPSSCGVKAVQTWVGRVSSNETNSWNSVCWSPELRLFVAVAGNGGTRVMTSPNGINWTGWLSANESVRWLSICWSPELRLFVAVAQLGGINAMTSSNGTIWNGYVTNSAGLSCICWSPELMLFVAVGETSDVVISKNGTTWNIVVKPNFNYWVSVCWSKELGIFVAVAWTGTAIGTTRVMTSPNGITWTGRRSADDSFSWWSVCWSGELGLFVSVARFNPAAMISPDGINWTLLTLPNAGWYNVCWSQELRLFVAVSHSGGTRIVTSPNGINWSSRAPASGNEFTSTCWSPELGIFVSVAQSYSTTRVMTSSLKGRPPTSYNLFDNMYIITSDNAGAIGWTYNAWTNDASTGLDSTSSYTVAVNLGEGNIATTVNGVVFQSHALSGTNFSIGGVASTHPPGSPTQNISGAGVALADKFIFNSTNRTVTLTNLTFGAKYKTSFFSVAWDANADTIRNQTFTAVDNGTGVILNPNIYGQYMGIIINCTFVANNTGTQVFTITSFNQTFHMYALANRLVVPVFTNISTNSIDENGKWDFSNINVTTLTANGASVSSDDRLKHNEINIANGLDIIDQLTPKFYQKTQVLLDAHYNGDLSNYAWSHEAGLIAQELLQISDLSYVVSGGDYYEQTYIIRNSNYDLSNTNYEVSYTNYDLSNTNYDLSNTNYDLSNSNYDITNTNYDLSNSNYDITNTNYDLSNTNYEESNANYDLSYNVIPQPYNVNYNSIFVYGLAAIKELHTKVKAQETSILDEQLNNLVTRVEALESIVD